MKKLLNCAAIIILTTGLQQAQGSTAPESAGINSRLIASLTETQQQLTAQLEELTRNLQAADVRTFIAADKSLTYLRRACEEATGKLQMFDELVKNKKEEFKRDPVYRIHTLLKTVEYAIESTEEDVSKAVHIYNRAADELESKLWINQFGPSVLTNLTDVVLLQIEMDRRSRPGETDFGRPICEDIEQYRIKKIRELCNSPAYNGPRGRALLDMRRLNEEKTKSLDAIQKEIDEMKRDFFNLK